MDPNWTDLTERAPELSLRWATRSECEARTFGRVRKPETYDYRTQAPEPGGLFDPENRSQPLRCIVSELLVLPTAVRPLVALGDGKFGVRWRRWGSRSTSEATHRMP